MQNMMRLYRSETNKDEIDMHELAVWAIGRGWPMPRPLSPVEMLASQFAQAAREEIKKDAKTGHPYRVNHAVSTTLPDGRQLMFGLTLTERRANKCTSRFSFGVSRW